MCCIDRLKSQPEADTCETQRHKTNGGFMVSNPPGSIWSRPPNELLDWVKSCVIEPRLAPDGFNWHGLAEGAGMKAGELNESSPVWAEIAVRTYQWLADQAGDASTARSFEFSGMLIRAREIAAGRHGNADAPQSPDALMAWFDKVAVMTPDEAVAKSRVWRELPIDEIQGLRHIKNALAPFELIAKIDGLLDVTFPNHYERLHGWLDVRKVLP
jgi:hypothetical protein